MDWGKVRAEKVGSNVKVSWSTYKETDNSKFEIEHSTDGKDLRMFKEVIVNENSNSLKTYSVMHENAVNTNYYRVKQIDFNGTYSYSEVTHLALTRSSNVNVYPNPMTDKLYIEGIDLSHADIQVLDVRAKEIQAYDIDLQTNALNMDRLSQRAYFIVIHSQDGTHQYKIYKH